MTDHSWDCCLNGNTDECSGPFQVANAGGVVVQEVTDKRHQLWRFVRGPLVGFPTVHFPRDRPAPSWWLLDFV